MASFLDQRRSRRYTIGSSPRNAQFGDELKALKIQIWGEGPKPPRFVAFEDYVAQLKGLPVAPPPKKKKIDDEPRKKLLQKIEEIMFEIITSLFRKEPISLTHPPVSWKQVHFTNRLEYGPRVPRKNQVVSITRKRSRRNLSLLVRLLEKAHYLLSTNTTVTKRELYYQFLLRNQAMLDRGVLVVSHILDTPPWQLGFLSSGKGVVVGDLTIHFDEDSVQCNRYLMVPTDIHRATSLTSGALFVLIVEKEAIFHQLCEEDLLSHLGSNILITGKGYPDMCTRQLVKMIADQLKIPILILVDADPHGIDIMCTYRFGSLAMCKFSQQLAVPEIRWMGVHPTDFDFLNLDKRGLVPLTARDMTLAKNLLKRDYIKQHSQIKEQVELLVKKKVKAEIEVIVGKAKYFLTYFYMEWKVIQKKSI
ncbi:meiotic recombination protein SPO11 [Cloeon dipterum]|uniref:meiotic recombination protein SPO11 n=1 Tax=Cloeon dipterum TaxID=197152 RepID=UPI00321F774A